MSKVAFELRADHEDFSGGSVNLGDGVLYNVGEALAAGSGKITLNPDPGERKDPDAQEKENERARGDERIAAALDAFPALKRASAAASSTSKEGK